MSVSSQAFVSPAVHGSENVTVSKNGLISATLTSKFGSGEAKWSGGASAITSAWNNPSSAPIPSGSFASSSSETGVSASGDR